MKEHKSIESATEIAREFRGLFVRVLQEDRPPCVECSDEKIARCALSSYECHTYKRYVGKKNTTN